MLPASPANSARLAGAGGTALPPRLHRRCRHAFVPLLPSARSEHRVDGTIVAYMKISVITVCFNSEQTISDTMRSVAIQTHPD